MKLRSEQWAVGSGQWDRASVRAARCSLPTRHSHRRGLSLIEVLLAMTIFFIAIVAISRLVDMGTDYELESRLHATGARLAQAKLAEFETGIETLSESSSGEFGDSDAGWSWSMNSELQGTNLYLVSVTVTRDMKGRPFTLTLAQMVLDPAAKGAAAEAARPDPSGG
ncbi:Type II secretion system protein I/J OS=Planctomyces limnophilus (strain ATCC 43296 / DSM 3776 / IFAM 1008 / 290) GN=Plim_3637 PE=4 SV=1 [Gemmataceae bacterium]|nr:Type II secretion system protein I/J OS=Planctomyces limnophilus (strain ATCC 43296 / DSM 3776 / IFAM 1008 / 290) GN=Plim_3637 PE=4 SV=1 [Gemmataceae bacterium]VTT99347.1 Type II secretion system protein I/J OS=Planctomyces limnophilus (strain ATCC 43296 / DSM 3776 / IFAM 1008 / 290) GN=Plim_3637 PE=4 SV=1 [Gemmataceae bacterium]